MSRDELQERLIDIETALDSQARNLEDLSEMVIKQGKLIDYLLKQNEILRNAASSDVVKPLEEETPPPHY